MESLGGSSPGGLGVSNAPERPNHLRYKMTIRNASQHDAGVLQQASERCAQGMLELGNGLALELFPDGSVTVEATAQQYA